MRKIDNPYKILFSLGIASGILGVLIWVLFNNQLISFYPKQAHAQIMFFGFFWSFVAGFLFTAIPRMTGTHFASSLDVALSSIFVLLQNVINYTQFYNFSPFIFILQTFFLLYFIIPRFLEKKKIPFDGFLFFPAAFFMSLLGATLYYYNNDTRFLFAFTGEAFLTNLIVGLGSRLIPALSRLPNAFMHPGMVVPLKWKSALLKVAILNFSFVIEVLNYKEAAYLLRLLVVGYIAINSFGLFKKSSVFSMMGLGLKVSVLFIIFSYVSKLLLFNDSSVANAHLLYIGGLGLLTLLVATRVTLSHSQTNLDYELRSVLIGVMTFSMAMAAMLRWASGYGISGGLINFSIILFTATFLMWLWKHLSLVRSALIQKD